MQSILERIHSTGAEPAGVVPASELPAWANAAPREDLVQEFLITQHEETALAQFARDSARSCSVVDGRSQFVELMLIPIIHPGPVPIGSNPQLWLEAQDLLVKQLHQLFPREWRMGFFKEILAVEDLLGMPYRARRVYLAPPTPQTESVSIQEYPRLHGRLPTIVPQLGFIVVKAESEKEWPSAQLHDCWAEPSAAVPIGSVTPEEILERAGRILQLAAWETPIREPDLPTILRPGSWSQAVGRGVCEWLRLLDTTTTITGYDIALDPRDVDLCSLEIRLASGGRQNPELDDRQAMTLRLGVRRHALEPRVWRAILTKLHRLGEKTERQRTMNSC